MRSTAEGKVNADDQDDADNDDDNDDENDDDNDDYDEPSMIITSH